jgi:rod shape-determining protein MreC
VLLQSICFYLIIRNKNFHQAGFINSTNKVATSVNNIVSAVTEYISLKESNEALSRENAALKTLMPDVFYIDSVQQRLVNDTQLLQQYTFTPAKVINNSFNRRNNYLTLNKGTRHGIDTGMAVVNSSGVVGIVKNVSPHYSSVMSLLHKDTRLSARIKKNNYIGSIVWNDGVDPDRVTLNDIARHVPVAKGDTIVTSSYSAIFPEGIMVGTVESIDQNSGMNFFKITVKLSTNFRNLTTVFVVNNLMKTEQLQVQEGQVIE